MAGMTVPVERPAEDRLADPASGGPVPPRTVVVVDDHELLRAGTRRILNDADDFRVIGEAADAQQALDLVEELEPDVVLLDIRLPTGNGIEVARRILAARPQVTVVILSAYDDEHYVQAALAAGVSGYLLKTVPADELVRLIRSACEGLTVVVDAPTSGGERPDGAAEELTVREQEVVRLVIRGLANKQIARRLGISPRTVEGHLNRVFEKVDAASRTELVHYALTHGLFASDEPGPERRST